MRNGDYPIIFSLKPALGVYSVMVTDHHGTHRLLKACQLRRLVNHIKAKNAKDISLRVH